MTGRTKIIRKPSPWPILIGALGWVIVCLILPMIQLWHYLIALVAGGGAYFIARKRIPDRLQRHDRQADRGESLAPPLLQPQGRG